MTTLPTIAPTERADSLSVQNHRRLTGAHFRGHEPASKECARQLSTRLAKGQVFDRPPTLARAAGVPCMTPPSGAFESARQTGLTPHCRLDKRQPNSDDSSVKSRAFAARTLASASHPSESCTTLSLRNGRSPRCMNRCEMGMQHTRLSAMRPLPSPTFLTSPRKPPKLREIRSSSNEARIEVEMSIVCPSKFGFLPRSCLDLETSQLGSRLCTHCVMTWI